MKKPRKLAKAKAQPKAKTKPRPKRPSEIAAAKAKTKKKPQRISIDQLMEGMATAAREAIQPIADRVEKLEAAAHPATLARDVGRVGVAGATNIAELAAENRSRVQSLVDRLSTHAHRLGIPRDPQPVGNGAEVAQRESMLSMLVDTKHAISAGMSLLDALDANT